MTRFILTLVAAKGGEEKKSVFTGNEQVVKEMFVSLRNRFLSKVNLSAKPNTFLFNDDGTMREFSFSSYTYQGADPFQNAISL